MVQYRGVKTTLKRCAKWVRNVVINGGIRALSNPLLLLCD